MTVLIIDDHAAFRDSVRTLLEVEGFDVVGEARDGATGIELARRLEPELVLLDVVLPDTSGFEVAERLAGLRRRVILTSSREQADYGTRIARSGALGFLPKDRLSGPALHRMLSGRP